MDGEAIAAGIHTGTAAHRRRRAALPSIVMVFGIATVALMAIFQAADWYAKNVSLRRYCGDTGTALALVRPILTGGNAAATKTAGPYVIAAKLLYLVPQRHDETASDYLVRLKKQIEINCR